MTDLSDKLVLVTGASRGFGFAAARALGAAGAHVVAVARTVGGLEELDDLIKAAGGSATLVPLDITDDPALERMGAAIHGRWGRADIWLHTAFATAPLTPVEHIGIKDFDKGLAVNIRAFQRLIRVIDPLLKFADDGMALIASDDRAGEKFHGAYAAHKAAQTALTRAWAAETEGRLRVAELVPPPMPTAHRARFYPGENRERLTPIDTAAERLIERLADPVESGSRIVLDCG